MQLGTRSLQKEPLVIRLHGQPPRKDGVGVRITPVSSFMVRTQANPDATIQRMLVTS